jgi:hypothetical protein
MAFWDKINARGTVSDRRGNPMVLGGGLGIVAVGIALLVTYLSGGDVLQALLNVVSEQQFNATPEDAALFEGEDPYEEFVSTVLGSTDVYWTLQFSKLGKDYTLPELVLFRGQTQSACGGADSVVGPHYCLLDGKIYLDETFFEQLQTHLGAEGGDVAQAYVIAHEVGHHVQNELDLLNTSLHQESAIVSELQADCFAGLWLGSLKEQGVFEAGEIQEALDAASSVGDDNVQLRTEGHIQPESWTHGSSADRMQSFMQGYNGNSIEQCL